MSKGKIKVFYEKNFEIVETACDQFKFGYPNFADDGEQMFINTHFRTKKEAIENAIVEMQAGISLASRDRQYHELKLKECANNIEEFLHHIEKMRELLKDET
jgi:hypothetical protein